MKVKVLQTSEEVGIASAKHAAEILNQTIKENGTARLLLSTGASQFPFFKHIVHENVQWDKVEMFHLDEYLGISPNHPASFQKYLTERFVDIVKPGKVHLIDGLKEPDETIGELTELLRDRPVDLGMIGIGENAHIAFNDPPADFYDMRAYKVVSLSDTCIRQQLHEKWFASVDDAFKKAISMTCSKIMECKKIICVVPYQVKADAVYKTLVYDETRDIPATLLKRHDNVTVYLDCDSASLLNSDILEKFL